MVSESEWVPSLIMMIKFGRVVESDDGSSRRPR